MKIKITKHPITHRYLEEKLGIKIKTFIKSSKELIIELEDNPRTMTKEKLDLLAKELEIIFEKVNHIEVEIT